MTLDELVAKRIELGITQKEVAKYVGVDKSTISDYERREHKISKRAFTRYQCFIRKCMRGAIKYSTSRNVSSLAIPDKREKNLNKEVLIIIREYFKNNKSESSAQPSTTNTPVARKVVDDYPRTKEGWRIVGSFD